MDGLQVIMDILEKQLMGVKTGYKYKICNLINYNDLFFIDLNNGLLVADYGNIFLTADGGNTWQPVSSGTGFDINKLFYLDENNIWAVGYNGIMLKKQVRSILGI